MFEHHLHLTRLACYWQRGWCDRIIFRVGKWLNVWWRFETVQSLVHMHYFHGRCDAFLRGLSINRVNARWVEKTVSYVDLRQANRDD